MTERSRVIPLRTQETIEKEAADWLAKLDRGGLSQAERAELRTWLSQDQQHQSALKSYCSFWEEMNFFFNEFPSSSTAGDARPDAVGLGLPRMSLTAKILPLVFASVFVLSIGLGLWFGTRLGPTQDSVYVTEVGVQKTEQLADGSKAHLNTNSVIQVEYSDSARIVRLLRGEAKFDVAHNPERPFIVFAGNQQVMAVGTEFVVRLVADNILVTVTDGKVRLSRSSEISDVPTGAQEAVLISEGEVVDFNMTDKSPPPEPKKASLQEMNRRLSWLERVLVFDNERLEDVVAEISRYVPDQIVIEDEELRSVRISGRFRIGDGKALLEAMKASFDVEEKPDGVHVIRNGGSL